MEKYHVECGPEAIDNYDDYNNYSRHHNIYGSGSVTGNHAINVSGYSDSYYVNEGITELCDECFSSLSIDRVLLPDTLKVIGNKCFYSSRIKSINLPDGLEKIGHNNFPSTLTSIKIPLAIKDFPIDNVIGCNDLTAISVDEKNEFYKAKDGLLYNHDMTELLSCPNSKRGTVVIPNTVTRIGDSCFVNCKKLDAIIIPSSAVEIGECAFSGISIKKLIIRNSVKSIGLGCFATANITEEFKLSHQITALPPSAFASYSGTCISSNLINRLKYIGDSAFYNTGSLPKTISLCYAKEINNNAFKNVSGVSTIELFSSLEKIGSAAFSMNDILGKFVIRYFGYAPMNIGEDVLGNEHSKDATLVVPKGTKMIFENASPWNAFPHIEEWDVSLDRNDEGKFIDVSDEIYCKRLLSIADSKNKADRCYLSEIIKDLAQSYLYVDSDEEYEEAMSLIAYNRSFSPAIIPDFEKQLCSEWTNKYKLKMVDHEVVNSHVSPLFLPGQEEPTTPTSVDIIELPLLQPVEIPSIQQGMDSVAAYFNEGILKQLQNMLTMAKQSVKIAVSWFTNFTLFKQIGQLAEAGVKIQLIINNDLVNNGGYCLNFNELIEKGVEISLVEYPHLLHHKFAIIDDECLLTGSYNWTRFSGKNYENMVVINDEAIVDQFRMEFEDLLDKAEYKCIDKMPEYVKERPEYDRSAFKQYITEELDAQARESTNERDKITALKKACELNPSYLEKINPGVQEKYRESFNVIDDTISIQKTVIKQSQIHNSTINSPHTNAFTKTDVTPASETQVGKVLTREQEKTIEKVAASSLIMVLDVSGSMAETYLNGHVHEITKKALAAAIVLTKKQEAEVWTFGDDAKYIGSFGVNQIDQIKQINYQNELTNLQRFVEMANNSILDGALCIIFTDDDLTSISMAVEGMKKREKVFWQIISYEQDVKNIKATINSIKNISVVTLSDYQNRTTEEINSMLLHDYLNWKNL